MKRDETTDLTAITTPFGLLDKETQDALMAHHAAGGDVEIYSVDGWVDVDPAWCNPSVYRARPERKPREWLLRVDGNGRLIDGYTENRGFVTFGPSGSLVRVREILEDGDETR